MIRVAIGAAPVQITVPHLWLDTYLTRKAHHTGRLRRAEVLKFFSALPPRLVGMEPCASAHHWGRELIALGHDVRLMPPAYVKPYVKRRVILALGTVNRIFQPVTRRLI